MKRILIVLAAFFVLTFSVKAEDVFMTGRTDRLMIDLFTDFWSNVPSSMDVYTINRGVNISMMQDFRLWRSSFSVATGLGIASHNLYSDHFYKFTPIHESSTWPQPGQFDFNPIYDTYGELKKNKLNLNYLNLPFEFRYRNNNLSHTLRVYAGLRLGFLINAHTKTHLKNANGVFGAGTQTEWKYKEHKLGNLEKFQFGVTGRIGYGRLNLFAYMPLTNVFEGNNSTEMKPFSIGLTFIVY